MPFIDCKMNVSITPQQETALKTELGKAITAIPGKSESWLMVNIQPSCALYFRGSKDKPAAMVNVTIYGKAQPSAYSALTQRLDSVLRSVAGIEEIYVSYAETSNWGYNGSNF